MADEKQEPNDDEYAALDAIKKALDGFTERAAREGVWLAFALLEGRDY